MLVLEEEHRIVAADRRSQKSGGVLGVRRETRCGCRGSARRCSRPTGCGTVHRRADSRRWRRESPSGTRTRCSTGTAASTFRRGAASSPARCSRRTGSRRTGLSPRVAMPMLRPMIAASARGELNTRSLPNARCKPCVTLKTPPFPGTEASARDAAAIGDVLTEDDNPRIARHFVLERPIDGGNHRVRPSFRNGSGLKASDVGSTSGE